MVHLTSERHPDQPFVAGALLHCQIWSAKAEVRGSCRWARCPEPGRIGSLNPGGVACPSTLKFNLEQKHEHVGVVNPGSFKKETLTVPSHTPSFLWNLIIYLFKLTLHPVDLSFSFDDL